MSELPDFLSDEPSSAPEPTPVSEPAAPPAPQPTPEPVAEGPQRGPDGRFAPVEAPPPAEPPPAAPVEPAHHVPLTTFLDVRDKLSAAEKEARELREWRQQQEAERNRQPPPNRDEDPEAYEAHRQAMVADELFVQRRDFSREIATIKHGDQVVNAAFEWGASLCDRDPHFNAKVRSHPNPMEFVVSEWRRDQVASKVDPNDYDAFLAWKASGGASPAPAQPAPTAAPTPAPAAPRPSLASGPSAGAHAGAIPRDGQATFDAMFGSE